MVHNIFEVIKQSPEHLQFAIKVAMVEIYMEKIHDLIEPSKRNL